jgi:hypothetical protein
LAWVKVLEKNEEGWRSEIKIGLLLWESKMSHAKC